MAIYPYFSTTIINKDVLTNSSFKAGMALVLDNNGRAIKADSQLLLFDSAAQKYGKFLGFATSDHDISGNTIIIPDVIGSNYLDSNLNFVKTENTEYSVPKRALLDYQDSAISSFYNNTDLNPTAKRGVGVYNTPGDYFVTDQFVRVLHGDYGLDSTTLVDLNPGDLLTFGGGINAGKLVKVNIDSFGPEVLIIGTVLKHVPAAGLLYFKQTNYRSLFGTNPYLFSADPGNIASYSPGSTTALNLANSSNSATLLNGTGYSSLAGGCWSFDGTNDGINTAINIDNDPIGIHAWVYCTEVTSGGGRGIVLSDNGGWDRGLEIYNSQLGVHTGSPINQTILGTVSNNTWYNVFLSYVSNVWTLYVNGSLIGSGVSAPSSGSLATIGRADAFSGTRIFQGLISQVNIYNRGLTATEITNYYNATRGRYGV
jgi:hypothetical protein